jgi:hypothetical protein
MFSRMVVNAITRFFYIDGIFKFMLEWNICINVLGDYGDK